MTLPDMWKNIKTFWTLTLTPKSRWTIVIIFAIIITINTILEAPRDAIIGLIIILSGVPLYYYWKKQILKMKKNVLNKSFGCQNMTDPIRSVIVKHPENAYISQSDVDKQAPKLNYFGTPKFDGAINDFNKFINILISFGSEIHFLPKFQCVKVVYHMFL